MTEAVIRDALMVVLFCAGLVMVAAGAWLVDPSAGLIVGGAELVALVVLYARATAASAARRERERTQQ